MFTQTIRKYFSNVHKMGGAHLQCVNNNSAKFEYKGMNTVGVTDYTNKATPKHFGWEKYLKFNTRQKGENIYQMSTKWEVHIFNVCKV